MGDVINNLEEWIIAQQASFTGGVGAGGQNGGGFWSGRTADATTRIASRNQMNGVGRKWTSQDERDARLRYLMKLIDDGFIF